MPTKCCQPNKAATKATARHAYIHTYIYSSCRSLALLTCFTWLAAFRRHSGYYCRRRLDEFLSSTVYLQESDEKSSSEKFKRPRAQAQVKQEPFCGVCALCCFGEGQTDWEALVCDKTTALITPTPLTSSPLAPAFFAIINAATNKGSSQTRVRCRRAPALLRVLSPA